MARLFNAVKGYLNTRDWDYDMDDEAGCITFRMRLETVEQCAVWIQMRDDDALSVYTVFPDRVPPEKRADMAEFITRANYGLVHGNFEMDFDDGEIRYKITDSCGDTALDTRGLDRALNIGFYMLDRYAPAIFALLNDGVSPDAAVKSIENATDEESGD